MQNAVYEDICTAEADFFCDVLCNYALCAVLQFVDSTIRGLLSWGPDSGALLQDLRDQVYFTQRQKVRRS
jgi:hypothetical protein